MVFFESLSHIILTISSFALFLPTFTSSINTIYLNLLTFALGPDVNFLTGHAVADNVMRRYLDDILIATFQARYRISVILRHQFGLCPCLSCDAVRNGIPLQWGTTVVRRIPADTYAISWRILHNDLGGEGWLHGNHLILNLIASEQIIRRTSVISGQTALYACSPVPLSIAIGHSIFTIPRVVMCDCQNFQYVT